MHVLVSGRCSSVEVITIPQVPRRRFGCEADCGQFEKLNIVSDTKSYSGGVLVRCIVETIGD